MTGRADRFRLLSTVLLAALLVISAAFLLWGWLTGMSTRRFTWIIVAGKPWCILAYSLFFAYIIK